MVGMMCTVCGISFYGKSISNKKKIVCKHCRKEKQSNHSAVLLFLFLEKLKVFEEGLYDIIKMYEMPMFTSRACYNDDTYITGVTNISNFYNLDTMKFRYSKRMIKYLRKNKDRLTLRHSKFYERGEVLLSIDYQTIPLCYLPYTKLERESYQDIQMHGDITYLYCIYELITIDYDKFELDLSRKLLKDFGFKFDLMTGTIRHSPHRIDL